MAGRAAAAPRQSLLSRVASNHRPHHFLLLQAFRQGALFHLSYATYRIYHCIYLRSSHARKPHLASALRHYPRRQHRLTHYWRLMSGYSKIVLLNSAFLRLIRLPSHHAFLGLTLLPVCHICCYHRNHRPSRELHRFGIYLYSFGCTYGLNTVYFHSIWL